MTKYFVMVVTNQKGAYILPLTRNIRGGEDVVALFDTPEEAKKAAVENPLGESFGYQVFHFIGLNR